MLDSTDSSWLEELLIALPVNEPAVLDRADPVAVNPPDTTAAEVVEADIILPALPLELVITDDMSPT